jgi:hypothetical protein
LFVARLDTVGNAGDSGIADAADVDPFGRLAQTPQQLTERLAQRTPNGADLRVVGRIPCAFNDYVVDGVNTLLRGHRHGQAEKQNYTADKSSEHCKRGCFHYGRAETRIALNRVSIAAVIRQSTEACHHLSIHPQRSDRR